jgi:hypothetical protein
MNMDATLNDEDSRMDFFFFSEQSFRSFELGKSCQTGLFLLQAEVESDSSILKRLQLIYLL